TAAARSPSWAADWRKVTRLSMEASWLRVWTLSPYGKLSLSRVECKSESVSHKALPYHSHTFLALGAKVKSTSISARSVRPSSRGGDEPAAHEISIDQQRPASRRTGLAATSAVESVHTVNTAQMPRAAHENGGWSRRRSALPRAIFYRENRTRL